MDSYINVKVQNQGHVAISAGIHVSSQFQSLAFDLLIDFCDRRKSLLLSRKR